MEHLHDAGRRAAFDAGLGDQRRGHRRLLGRAADDRTAGRERRRDLARDQVDRKIPRSECSNDADRLGHRRQPPALARRDRLAEQPLGLAGKPVELFDRDLDFAVRLRNRPTDLQRQRARNVGFAPLHGARDAAQDFGTLPAMHRGPFRKRGPSVMQGFLDLASAGGWCIPQNLFRTWIYDRNRRFLRLTKELSANQKFRSALGHERFPSGQEISGSLGLVLTGSRSPRRRHRRSARSCSCPTAPRRRSPGRRHPADRRSGRADFARG